MATEFSSSSFNSALGHASETLRPAIQETMVASTATVSLSANPSSTTDSPFRIILTILKIIPGVLYWIITFVTITVPRWSFSLASTSLTFTMNATTLLLVLLGLVSTISWIVRYRFLNMYTRLPPEPQRKEPQIDVFPDTQEGDSKPGLANYLDEFLSAIKVFGYLERPVFHELTRTMQTRKLIAGETLLLEQEKGFCLVVDGLVQIFVKSNVEGQASAVDIVADFEGSTSDEELRGRGNQGYQLLTEVKNGAPMSSLFSILSLFTEDVKLRYEVETQSGIESEPPSAGPRLTLNTRSSYNTGIITPGSEAMSPIAPPFSPRRPMGRRTSAEVNSAMGGASRSVPPLSLDSPFEQPSHHPAKVSAVRDDSGTRKSKSAHPDVLARATVDTTIAIIPATAFKRLTRVYPRASAHIVQVILTRLQRVTLGTGHAYLGLTKEVLRTEKLMNKYTTYDLPGFLRGAALERLKEKFVKERERTGPEEGMKGIALHNPGAGRRPTSRSELRRQATLHTRDEAEKGHPSHGGPSPSTLRRTLPDSRRSGVSAGDLLMNTHASQSGPPSRLSFSQPVQTPALITHDASNPLASDDFNPFAASMRPGAQPHRQESIDEDSIFREAILDCMFKAIGLASPHDALQKPASVEQSPRLVSYDSRRQKAVFNNAFGFMDPYEAFVNGETESLASTSLSNISFNGSRNIHEELIDDIEIVHFPKGAILVEQGERNPGLYYVIDGFLDVSIPVAEHDSDSSVLGNVAGQSGLLDSIHARKMKQFSASPSGMGSQGISRDKRKRKKLESRKSLFLTKPGGLAGYLGTISSYRSFIDVTAKTDVYVGFLPRASIERIVEKYPVVLLTMAKRLTSLLPRLILHIDFALEWVQVNAGQVIYRQGDESDAIYIVLNGRLRAIQDTEGGGMKVIGEFGQGDSVGELEVLTESLRPGTLHAIRDTELAKFPKTLFNSLALEHPGITIKISKIIATRMRSLLENSSVETGRNGPATKSSSNPSSTVNLRTVAILPVTAGVPVVEFSTRLLNALTQIGTPNGVVSLNQSTILNHLGRHAFNRMGKLKLSQYLADLEEKYGLVLYVADTNVNSPWTQTCISQADCILLVAVAEGSPNVGEYERFLLTTKSTARKELVLLHAERYCPPGLTRQWLRNRVWINGGHHHIQMAFRTTAEPVNPQTRRFGMALKQRVQVIQAEIQKYTSRRARQTPFYSADTPFKGDFHRLARRLCGKTVGLVLGGGGARGVAHIGIIRALEEAGIPIDIIGGTSIGAFIGALYAWDADVVPMYGRAKRFAGRMGSMWRFALDLTYPSASYTTGHEFNRGIFKTFGTSMIEDSWLPFYCNTTNISTSLACFHTSGYVWRYVRASMSLAGLIPPLCDEGEMLLDGGYIDNLTVSHMRGLGADAIFAVDVGSVYMNDHQAFGDSLSGFWAVFNRWNPFSSYPNPPTLSEIQARLAYVSSVDALERAKTMPGCRYMRPPIDPYGTLEFAKFEEIYQVGYRYAKEFLRELREKGDLGGIGGTAALGEEDDSGEGKRVRRAMAPRRASI